MQGFNPNHSSVWPRQELSPVAQLRECARLAFPHSQIPSSEDADENIKDVWDQLAKCLSVTDMALAKALSAFLHIDYPENLTPAARLIHQCPSAIARDNLILPLCEQDGTVFVVTASPFDEDPPNKMKFIFGKPVELVIAPPHLIEEAIHKAYSKKADILTQQLSDVALPDNTKSGETGSDNATESLAQVMLKNAIKKRASDIHLKPFIRGSEVRFRIDGVLQRVALLADEVGERIIRYFKARGKMNPSNSSIPQDGSMSLTFDDKQFELRLSVLPATGGESLVIRFLEQGRIFSLANTQLSVLASQALKKMLTNVSGLILMTGPTGSGKSTTLYAMLSEINRIGINITTIEDPVEYRVNGLTQVQANEKAGLTFPSVIRACMRQDPDVLLIGEIRDAETAQVAIQAAVTGHLVLSTLHTNDAVTTVARLAGLGIHPTVLAESLIGAVSQRLVRKLCNHCKIEVSPDAMQTEEALFEQITGITPSFRAGHCKQCNETGYSGRIPVIEIFENSAEVAALVANGIISREQLAQENNGPVKSLAGSASRLIVSGETSVAEVMRVLGVTFWQHLATEFGTQASASIPAINQQQQSSALSVLMISQDPLLIADMTQLLAEKNIPCLSCATADEASALLQQDDQICFIIGDLEHQQDEANVALFNEARIKLYWSYLPALLLIPNGHQALQEKLRDIGVISEMLEKPISAEEIYHRLQSYL